MVPVAGVNLATYFSNSVLDEQFPFLVPSNDPIQCHLGIREAFYAQRWDLVLQTAVDRTMKFARRSADTNSSRGMVWLFRGATLVFTATNCTELLVSVLRTR